MQVELVYEKTCPNIEAARVQLLRAFVEAGVSPQWQEWEVSTPDAPTHIHGFGSPSILVNSDDVSGLMAESDGDDYCCRVYAHDDANKGVPTVADIVRALHAAQATKMHKSKSWLGRFALGGASLPSLGVALLPKLTCPACWPAYAGLLSAMGIGFIDYTPYLLPLTIFFLIIVVASMAYHAHQRRGYKQLLLGLIAVAILLIGKFGFDSDVVMYTGLGLLVLASLWNTWPKKPSSAGEACPACKLVDQK